MAQLPRRCQPICTHQRVSDTADTGEAFERSLGDLLAWERAHPLHGRFFRLGSGNQNFVLDGAQQQYVQRMGERLDLIKRVVNQSLYDQFSQQRIDDEVAGKTYDTLLTILGQPEVFVATTNYDHSAEVGLEGAGHTVETGFPTRRGRTPRLTADGMFDRRGKHTVVAHLHGAVGWYESDGVVELYQPDKPFNASHRAPVILYPDPSKDPTQNELVGPLWREFRLALGWCDHILVTGHSLHDPVLVREIAAQASKKKIAVTYMDEGFATERSAPSATQRPCSSWRSVRHW
jgi:hypothetical protein